jgi:hypothetical protein
MQIENNEIEACLRQLAGIEDNEESLYSKIANLLEKALLEELNSSADPGKFDISNSKVVKNIALRYLEKFLSLKNVSSIPNWINLMTDTEVKITYDLLS